MLKVAERKVVRERAEGVLVTRVVVQALYVATGQLPNGGHPLMRGAQCVGLGIKWLGPRHAGVTVNRNNGAAAAQIMNWTVWQGWVRRSQDAHQSGTQDQQRPSGEPWQPGMHCKQGHYTCWYQEGSR